MDRLAAMETFVLVVDAGSFSAAARRLNIGQPAVSKLVAQLEERLGVKLLARTTRGLTATEAGFNYYQRARRSIEEADEAETAARGAGTSLTGKLRIAAAVTFARIHLMPRLPEFLQRHPDAARCSPLRPDRRRTRRLIARPKGSRGDRLTRAELLPSRLMPLDR